MKRSFYQCTMVSLIGTLLILGGCATTPPPCTADKAASDELRAVIYVPVATVQVVNDYLPYGEDPYVDHKLSPSPATHMEDWLTHKVRATGHEGSLIIRVQEASLRWRKRPGKLRAMKYWPYRAIVRLHVERIDRRGVKISEDVIQATRVREIHEGYFRTPSHNDWWQMFGQIQKDLGFELKRRLSQHVNARPAPQPSSTHAPAQRKTRASCMKETPSPAKKPHPKSRRAHAHPSSPRPLKKPSKRPRARHR
jgi:hypothetical protein